MRNRNVQGNAFCYAGPVDSGRGGSRKSPDGFSGVSPPAKPLGGAIFALKEFNMKLRAFGTKFEATALSLLILLGAIGFIGCPVAPVTPGTTEPDPILLPCELPQADKDALKASIDNAVEEIGGRIDSNGARLFASSFIMNYDKGRAREMFDEKTLAAWHASGNHDFCTPDVWEEWEYKTELDGADVHPHFTSEDLDAGKNAVNAKIDELYSVTNTKCLSYDCQNNTIDMILSLKDILPRKCNGLSTNPFDPHRQKHGPAAIEKIIPGMIRSGSFVPGPATTNDPRKEINVIGGGHVVFNGGTWYERSGAYHSGNDILNGRGPVFTGDGATMDGIPCIEPFDIRNGAFGAIQYYMDVEEDGFVCNGKPRDEAARKQFVNDVIGQLDLGLSW
ncbi:MAG: hypothetical protein LBQ69_04425 [Treponema sp.]|jgi:hypothetical protein|nr:hypothetical protein [Treponema sp.]